MTLLSSRFAPSVLKIASGTFGSASINAGSNADVPITGTGLSGYFTLSSPTITVAKAGYYSVYGTVRWSALNSQSDGILYTRIITTGGTGNGVTDSHYGNNYSTHPVFYQIFLSAGNTIKFNFVNNTTGAGNGTTVYAAGEWNVTFVPVQNYPQ